MHIGYMYICARQDSCSHSKETMCVLHVSVQQFRSDGKGTSCIVCILGILLCMALYTQIDMYVYIFYAWVLNSVLCRRYSSTCIYRCVLYIDMYMSILYMQVLNGCHAVTECVSCRLTSVYMYLHACTVQFVCTQTDICMYNVHYTFFTCRCSMSVSH